MDVPAPDFIARSVEVHTLPPFSARHVHPNAIARVLLVLATCGRFSLCVLRSRERVFLCMDVHFPISSWAGEPFFVLTAVFL